MAPFSSKDEPLSPIAGKWEWSNGSRVIMPSGFERLHRDRSSTYLVGDADFEFSFDEDGSFESLYGIPGMPTTFYSGNWTFDEDMLFLNYNVPDNFTGITEYRIPNYDDSNLDFQGSVNYSEFSDAQIEEWQNNGIDGSNGWTVDRDSLLTNFGASITATITLHFVKVN